MDLDRSCRHCGSDDTDTDNRVYDKELYYETLYCNSCDKFTDTTYEMISAEASEDE